MIIDNSTFISSSNEIIKGQIYSYESRLSISNSSFINTTSRYSTAIFAEENSKVVVSNSKFKNLFANKTAGAIALKKSSLLTINGCEFDNVSSMKNGGAVFVDINGDDHDKTGVVFIRNTKFNNCFSEFGGAILQLAGMLDITDTDFTSNAARYEGGAIYTSYADVNIKNCKFRSNILLDEISYG